MKSVVAFLILLAVGLAIAFPQYQTNTVPFGGSGAAQTFTYGNRKENLEGRIFLVPESKQFGAGGTYNKLFYFVNLNFRIKFQHSIFQQWSKFIL